MGDRWQRGRRSENLKGTDTLRGRLSAWLLVNGEIKLREIPMESGVTDAERDRRRGKPVRPALLRSNRLIARSSIFDLSGRIEEKPDLLSS